MVNWFLIRSLNVLALIVLTVAFPLAVIAARGYRDAPFGRILRPMPPMILLFVGMQAILILRPYRDYVPWLTFGRANAIYQWFWAVAVLLATYAAVQAILLLTGRRRL